MGRGFSFVRLIGAAGDSGYAAAGTVRDFEKRRDNVKVSCSHAAAPEPNR